MKRLLVTAALATALIVPALAGAALRPTIDEAWESADACLRAHGARLVTHRVDGGGFVYLRSRNANLYEAYWTYTVKSNGRVKSVRVHFRRGSGVTAPQRRLIRSCVHIGGI